MYPVGWVLLPLLLLLHSVVYLWISCDTGGEHVHPQWVQKKVVRGVELS
jgi:hypothetical protein